MKIALFSDIHLETKPQSKWRFRSGVVDLIILAGDIHSKARGVQWAIDTFDCPVLYIPGNHEGYGSHWQNTITKMREIAKGSHVHILNNDEIIIKGVRFLGSTLWTAFDAYKDSATAMSEAGKGRDVYSTGMREYKYIRTGAYRKIIPQDTKSWCIQSKRWLLNKFKEQFNGPTIVITPHAPILECLGRKPSHYLDASYVNDWQEGVDKSNASAWFFVHTHHHMHLYIGKTFLGTNPVGYEGEYIDDTYKDYIFELDNEGFIAPNKIDKPILTSEKIITEKDVRRGKY